MAELPALLDYVCPHPGCGARRGFRCTYLGYTTGHPARRRLWLSAINRRLRTCTDDQRPTFTALRDAVAAGLAEVIRQMATGA